MIFHITYQFRPEQSHETQQRFKATGALPPAGVTMLGRWHCVQGLKGFIIADTNDAEAIARWVQMWIDLIEFEVAPVISDEQVARVIG